MNSSLNLSLIYCPEAHSVSPDWLTSVCLCSNKLAVRTSSDRSGSPELQLKPQMHSQPPPQHNLAPFASRGEGTGCFVVLRYFVLNDVIRPFNSWLSLSCPRSKPLSSHLFYKADASEVKRCQLQAPHSTLSRSGMKGTRMQCLLVSLPAELTSDQFKCVLFLEKLKHLSSSLFVCLFVFHIQALMQWHHQSLLNKIYCLVIVRCTWSFSQSVSGFQDS